MFVFIAAVCGAIVGSFLNALSFRMGTGRLSTLFSPTSSGRSKCMRCGHALSAADLVPVFSWVFLRGRCRYGGTRIYRQYPLVEAAAAALGAGVALVNPEPVVFALWFVAWMTLLFAVAYDLRHFIIPWGCSLIVGALGLVWALASGGSWEALIAGPVLAAPLLALSYFSGGRWMGWGDGALELGLGWLLGLSLGFSAFVLAFWLGAAVGIVLMWSRRGYTMRSELPFAPFLVLGAGLAYFLHADILSILAAVL
jgi:prepilin signal peptidase PulO-like enzyme (type II secretory pathway)